MKQFVLITGVSSGFGESLLHHFHQNGYHIIGSVRKEADKQRLLKQFPENLTILSFDVRNTQVVETEIASIRPLIATGNLCLLVNNAGIAVPGPLELVSGDAFDEQWQVNVRSVWQITNLLLPELRAVQPGKIINISSVSGLINTTFLGAYCMSKHALESMSETYRRELQIFGIQVVTICPGPAKTEIWRKNLGKLNPYLQTPYGPYIQHADKLIQKSEENGLPADATTKAVWKAFTSKNPKIRYIVHKNPALIYFVSKVLPAKWVDILMAKTMNRGDKIRPI